jgi:hypothetical protein
MHVNDLIEFLADRKGSLDVEKVDGAIRITVSLPPIDLECPFTAVGSDVDALCKAVDKQYKKFMKDRGVVKLTRRKDVK